MKYARLALLIFRCISRCLLFCYLRLGIFEAMHTFQYVLIYYHLDYFIILSYIFGFFLNWWTLSVFSSAWISFLIVNLLPNWIFKELFLGPIMIVEKMSNCYFHFTDLRYKKRSLYVRFSKIFFIKRSFFLIFIM